MQRNPGWTTALVSHYGLAGVQLAVQLVMVPIYLKTIGKMQFGALMTILSIVNVAGLGVAWLQGGLMRAVGERYFGPEADRFRSLGPAYTAVKLVTLGYGLVAATVIFAAAWLPVSWIFGALPSGLAGVLKPALGLAALYYFVLNDLSSEFWTLSGAQRQTEANIALMIGPLVFVVLAVPWLGHGGGLVAVFACLLIGAAVSSLTARLLRNWRVGRVRWVFDAEMRAIAAGLAGRQALSYGIYGVAFTLLQADTLIVGVIGGAAMVAEFVLVWKIAEIVLLLLWKFPESLQPYLIASDVRGDRVHINDQYRMLIKWVPLAGLLAGLGYGLLGHRLVGLWVGAANVPAHQWYFVAAGGAVFWLAMARVFTLFAYTLKHFAPLNRALVAEVGAKILLIVLLVPVVGAGAPMLAVNLVHVLVMAWVYLWLGRLYFRGAQSAD